MSVLGIDDPMIWGAYVLCILSTLLCIAYGILYWNKGNENEAAEIAEEIKWEKQERAMEEEELGEVL